ncbi:MFS transporter [Paenibacillus qinlingensis]|uniref:PPP family 3-phenylpropionic acid transporter n=1 Tax=Paenibacillus qinlingensis TaxID=1837343 RepID=A0ABU1NTB5_9BACL|nr:MFS transporter [Paenibacillus qinlingensis]MDR6550719.1 PPP family 3-phenylpropionic acid transporter [Paenibacillus qinlingensis]
MAGKSTYVYMSVYYSLVFMALGAFSNYIPIYYNDIQLDHFQIGLLSTAAAVTAMIAQPRWGLAADRAASKNHLLLIALLLTSILVWTLPAAGNRFWLLFACTVVLGAVQCVINPLGDTITLEISRKSGFNFSRIRTAGSVGYALMAIIAGWLLDRNLNYMFPLFSGLVFLAFVLAWGIPKVEGHQNKSKVELKQLFTSRKLVVIYLYTLLVNCTLGFFTTFQAVYSKEQGMSTALIGIGVSIGSISQFPFMLFFQPLYRRFGIFKILLCSGIILAVRWLLFSGALSPAVYLATWVLHGGTFMLFYLCLAEYVSTHVPKELKASGQMMNSLTMNAISRTLGSLLGGLYAGWFGIRSGFAVSSFICVAAVVLFWYYYKPNDKEQMEMEGSAH